MYVYVNPNLLCFPICSGIVSDLILRLLAGGKAVASVGSVVEGDLVVGQAVKAFGTVHVLINNAGILREFSG